jgi:hypothetical protein
VIQEDFVFQRWSKFVNYDFNLCFFPSFYFYSVEVFTQIVETVDTIDQCQPFRIWDLSIQIVETVDTIYILINVSHLEFEIKFSYRLYTLIYYMIQQTIRSCVFIPFETYIKSNTSKCILIYQIVRAVGLVCFCFQLRCLMKNKTKQKHLCISKTLFQWSWNLPTKFVWHSWNVDTYEF